jgi:pimeloyl-ACP methyl ester carboxylesterase
MGGTDIAEEFTANIPNASLQILDGAGHAPWFDEPEPVGAQASAFLSS